MPALHAATRSIDAATGRPRGWVVLRRSERPASLLFTARCVGDGGFTAFTSALVGIKAALAREPVANLASALQVLLTAASDGFPVVLERRALALREHADEAEALLTDLRATDVHAMVAPVAPASWDPTPRPSSYWRCLPTWGRRCQSTYVSGGSR